MKDFDIMMIIITGTPGTGKTTATKVLKDKLNGVYISINSLIKEYDLTLGIDSKREYKIVDTEKMIPIVDNIKKNNPNKLIIFEGHIAQDYPNADLIIVLRCNPLVLKERLSTRNWKISKIDENINAEVLGVCSVESYETYPETIHEIDTTSKSPEEISSDIINIINNKNEFPIGNVDYLEEYFYLIKD